MAALLAQEIKKASRNPNYHRTNKPYRAMHCKSAITGAVTGTLPTEIGLLLMLACDRFTLLN
jgi:hypothetical protein